MLREVWKNNLWDKTFHACVQTKIKIKIKIISWKNNLDIKFLLKIRLDFSIEIFNFLGYYFIFYDQFKTFMEISNNLSEDARIYRSIIHTLRKVVKYFSVRPTMPCRVESICLWVVRHVLYASFYQIFFLKKWSLLVVPVEI